MVARGVGHVARNIAPPTMIRKQARSFLEQKIITRPIAAARRKVSKRRITVLEVIQGIVEQDGLKSTPLT